ncbi:MAG TPA: glycerol-3-phosphate dehydrogenase/oxidase [Vicinamibacterales bacterium]|nr:glycerol-3-phosphate dehydrogenase/oxidase [Vicinamibacterales bacterium]
MLRDLPRLARDPFDLLVVGGGVHGLAAAYDAAQRGFSVALVERGDFGSGASFNHLKTVHGGLRYLQTADLKRMRESILERRTLARIAPHLLTLLPFLMPTYRKPTRSRLAMRVAFRADAFIAGDRNQGVTPRLHLPAGRLLSKAECLQAFPDVRHHGLTGAALWHDYQMRNTERLTLAFALGADAAGACLANYVEAVRPLVEGGRAQGARVRDVTTGDEFDVRAGMTLNAAGAAAGRLMAGLGRTDPFPLIKAMNLVTRRPMSGPALASSTDEGRMLFLVPWEGRAMAGTSHGQQACGPDEAGVSPAEMEWFIDQVNQAFPALRLTPDDVALVHRGVVPAARSRKGEWGLEGHFRLRDHSLDGVEGAISMVAVKYTTARGVAEEAVDLVARKLGRRVPSRSAQVPLPGGDVPDLDVLVGMARREVGGRVDDETLGQIALTYGSGYPPLAQLVRDVPASAERLVPGLPVIRAQVLHAVRDEMALTLTDVVARRTPLGAAGHPGPAAARACAGVMAEELGWDEKRIEAETAALRDFYRPIPTSLA